MLANWIIYQQLHGFTEWNLIQCYSQRNLISFFNGKMGMKMSTVLTDKGELLLSNKVNGTSLIPEYFGIKLVFWVTWKGHCVRSLFPLIHSPFQALVLLKQIGCSSTNPSDIWFTHWQPVKPIWSSRLPWTGDFRFAPQRLSAVFMLLKWSWQCCSQ